MTQGHAGGRSLATVILSALTGFGLLSCNKPAPPPESQPPPVTIAKPVQKEIVEWDYYT